METIRKYMESLFTSLPNTEEVRRAKEHLLEMAEDKYTSLREEGVSENEAVAQVIAEFGNLDELKEELGIKETVDNDRANYGQARVLTLAEIKDFLADCKQAGAISALGRLCFICCFVAPILAQSKLGPVGMFGAIALGVILVVMGRSIREKWDFIEHTRCAIDMSTAEAVKEEYRANKPKIAITRCCGIILTAMCFVPPMIFKGAWSGATFFLSIGFGVFLLIFARKLEQSYETVLEINPNHTMGREYSKGSGRILYKDEKTAMWMSLYWPLVSFLYISVSFLTFSWHITWVIWVIAAVIRRCLDETMGERE